MIYDTKKFLYKRFVVLALDMAIKIFLIFLFIKERPDKYNNYYRGNK